MYSEEPSRQYLTRTGNDYEFNSIRDNFPKYVVSLDEFDMSRNSFQTICANEKQKVVFSAFLWYTFYVYNETEIRTE